MHLKKTDMFLMKKVKPLKDAFVLVLLRGEGPPRFARYGVNGYSVQGQFGIVKIDDSDLWSDISDLIN